MALRIHLLKTARGRLHPRPLHVCHLCHTGAYSSFRLKKNSPRRTALQTTWSNENSCASQGSYVQGSGAQCTIVNPALSGGGRGIPPIQQFYTSSSAISSSECAVTDWLQSFSPRSTRPAPVTGISGAQPSTTGGFSNAMDYVPVNVGYWSCQDTAVSAGASGSIPCEA